MQELLYKCGITWPTLALVLLYCSNAAVPRRCQGDDFAAMLLPWFCFGFGVLLPFPVAMQLLCHRCGFALLLCCFRCWCCWAGPLWPVMTSAPVGHHAPLQPLVTGPHLHPSPASSPPSSSSPSTLPSSSQSSVTGPPRFSFSYPLFPHDFLLVEEKAPSVSASILFCRFYSTDSASFCVLFAVSVCVSHSSVTTSISISTVSSIAIKKNKTKQMWHLCQFYKANTFHFFTANTGPNADLDFSASVSFYVPHCSD